MSMHVGLTSIGSEAQRVISRPSETLNCSRALSGGSWAEAGAAKTTTRAGRRRRSMGLALGKEEATASSIRGEIAFLQENAPAVEHRLRLLIIRMSMPRKRNADYTD